MWEWTASPFTGYPGFRAHPYREYSVEFSPREELRTEISAKFTPERLAGDLAAASLALGDVLMDPDGLFALFLSTPRARPPAP